MKIGKIPKTSGKLPPPNPGGVLFIIGVSSTTLTVIHLRMSTYWQIKVFQFILPETNSKFAPEKWMGKEYELRFLLGPIDRLFSGVVPSLFLRFREWSSWDFDQWLLSC